MVRDQAYLYLRFDKCNELPDQGSPLGYNKIASVFIILLFGALLSIIVLIYEFLKFPKKKNNDLFVSKEKRKLLDAQICVMLEKFHKENVHEFRSFCQSLDSILMKNGMYEHNS